MSDLPVPPRRARTIFDPLPAIAAEPPLRFWWRMLALGVSGACLSVLITAVVLTPSPAGVATHRALGLDACQFLERTGLPCPGCGMTTSFSWFVRANFPASLWVQPMGFALALGAAFTFWAGLYIAATGRPAHHLLLRIPGRYYLWPLVSLAVAAWGWKMLIHTNGCDGWR